MKVIFCTNNLPISLLVRLLTWSKWSHCGVVIGDEVIHATAIRGVYSEPLQSVKSRYKWEVREIDGEPEKAYKYLGSSYFDVNCSSLVARCSYAFNYDCALKATPRDCYMISHALNGDK